MSESHRVGYRQMAKVYFWCIMLEVKSPRKMIEMMIDAADEIFMKEHIDKVKDRIKKYV